MANQTATARSIVFPEQGRVELQTLELPPLGPTDVRVRTAFSGVSQGTERWVMHGRYIRFGDGEDGVRYPCRPGYGGAGIIEEVGGEVTGVAPGDHVAFDGGRVADDAYMHAGPASGCHATMVHTSQDRLVRIDPGIDLAAASLYRVAAVGRHGARLSEIADGETVVVIGQGLIGQMYAQAARCRGARVIASDLLENRLELSAKHSADVVVHAGDEDLGAVVRRETGGRGADVVTDTTGISAMWDTALGLVRHEGRICLQGYYPDPIQINFHNAHIMRVKVIFPCGWDAQDDPDMFEDIAKGRMSITPLITERLTISDVEERYQQIVDDPSASLGLVVDWAAS